MSPDVCNLAVSKQHNALTTRVTRTCAPSLSSLVPAVTAPLSIPQGASAADLNLDAEEVESEEFMSDKEPEEVPDAATPPPPAPLQRGKSLGEEWIKSSDEDSEEVPLSEPPKMDSVCPSLLHRCAAG